MPCLAMAAVVPTHGQGRKYIGCIFVSGEIVEPEVRNRVLAWYLGISMETLIGRHYSDERTLNEMLRAVRPVMSEFQAVSESLTATALDLQKLQADDVLQLPSSLDHQHVIALLACALDDVPSKARGWGRT